MCLDTAPPLPEAWQITEYASDRDTFVTTPSDPKTIVDARATALAGAHSLSLKSEIAKGKGKAASLASDLDDDELAPAPVKDAAVASDVDETADTWQPYDPTTFGSGNTTLSSKVGQGSGVHRADRNRADDDGHESFELSGFTSGDDEDGEDEEDEGEGGGKQGKGNDADEPEDDESKRGRALAEAELADMKSDAEIRASFEIVQPANDDENDDETVLMESLKAADNAKRAAALKEAADILVSEDERLGNRRAEEIAAQQTPPRDPSLPAPQLVGKLEPIATPLLPIIESADDGLTMQDIQPPARDRSPSPLAPTLTNSGDIDETDDSRTQENAERAAAGPASSSLTTSSSGPMREFTFPSPPASSSASLPPSSLPLADVADPGTLTAPLPHAFGNPRAQPIQAIAHGWGPMRIPGGRAIGLHPSGIGLNTSPHPFAGISSTPPLTLDVDMGVGELTGNVTVNPLLPRRNAARTTRTSSTTTPTEDNVDTSSIVKRPRNDSSNPADEERECSTLCPYYISLLIVHPPDEDTPAAKKSKSNKGKNKVSATGGKKTLVKAPANFNQ